MVYNLHHKSWVTISDELKTSDTVIIPLGAMEAHGAHKPVGCCYLLAESSSRDVGERTGVSVTPVIPFGTSEPYQNFPGTVSVSMATLSQFVYEAAVSLIRSGFRKIIFFSAHGDNNLPVLKELSFLLREEFGVLCTVIHVWGMVFNLVPPDMWGPDKKLGHGGEPTTSVMLHLHPELVDMSKAETPKIRSPLEGFETTSPTAHTFKGVSQSISLFAEEVESNGFMGDPTGASAEKGKLLYEKTINYLVDFVEAFRKLDADLD